VSEPTPTPPLTRFRATVQYDGTAFHGSQLQPDVRTVQGELETALSRLFDRATRVDFAGRTDTGVHALGQEVAFDAPVRWSGPEIRRGLTAILPNDIAPGEPVATRGAFHPRFDAQLRRYEYVVAPGKIGETPFWRDRAWRLGRQGRYALSGDIDDLNRLAARIPGERDFSGFAKAGQPERGTRCAVEAATWNERRGRYTFEILADRYLHHMVRYLVGTMIEIAANRRPESDLALMLAAKTPSRPVYPAPPGGLYLSGIRYADGWNRPAGVGW